MNDDEYKILIDDIRTGLKHSYCRNIIWNILALCDIYGIASRKSGYGEILEGKRHVGVDILKMLEEADPAAYARMQLERCYKNKSEGRKNGNTESNTESD